MGIQLRYYPNTSIYKHKIKRKKYLRMNVSYFGKMLEALWKLPPAREVGEASLDKLNLRRSGREGRRILAARNGIGAGHDHALRASSRTGEDRDFAARTVSAPDFYIVASFDDAPGRAARTQFRYCCWRRC